MALEVDYAAEAAFRRIVGGLRSVRLDAGLSQNALAAGLPVRGRAVSEWETCAIEPTRENLFLWSQELDQRLVIIGRDGTVHMNPVAQRPGESWFVFERRRLAFPLRNRRIALGMSHERLGEIVGVSKDSIQRWELTHVPPRPIAHIVWAQRLGYALEIRPIVAGLRRAGRCSYDRYMGSSNLELPDEQEPVESSAGQAATPRWRVYPTDMTDAE